MGYSVPTFNLTCDIYTGPWVTKALRLSSDCNLAMGRRVTFYHDNLDNQLECYGNIPNLLLPAGTDIRDTSCGHNFDIVEVPAGSGRWYEVMCVDDVGKGFDNEYRLATLGKAFDNNNGDGNYLGLFWPTPIP